MIELLASRLAMLLSERIVSLPHRNTLRPAASSPQKQSARRVFQALPALQPSTAGMPGAFHCDLISSQRSPSAPISASASVVRSTPAASPKSCRTSGMRDSTSEDSSSSRLACAAATSSSSRECVATRACASSAAAFIGGLRRVPMAS